ncbi:CapA family protein [Gottschalkiaceae bacterium SANA]|nr:CapA family protein [Gottschalkiaceae bacterium SANA]
MKRVGIIVCIGLLIMPGFIGFAQETGEVEALPFSEIILAQSEDEIVRLKDWQEDAEFLFTGDMMFHMPQIEGAKKDDEDGYDFSGSFSAIESLVSGADLAVANLETTLAGERLPYRGYPQFNTPDQAAEAIRSAGFDVLMTANNHSVDSGKRGLLRTLSVLDELGFQHTGTKVEEEEAVLIVEVQGIRVAMINATYGLNGLESYLTAEERVSLISIIGDGARIEAEIEAVKASVDFVIVLPHWGQEYQRQPSRLQKNLADRWFDAGADAIIGSHPHVIQPMEVRANGQFIAYSLGNAISNQRERVGKPAYWRFTEDGVLLFMTLSKNPWTGETSIIDLRAQPTHVERKWTGEEWSHRIVPASPEDMETKQSWERTKEQVPGKQNSQKLSEIVMNV